MGSPGLPHSSRALQVSMRLEKPLCPVSQRFSNIRPIGDGALSFFHGRSPSASFPHFFSSKRSMALYLWPCARIYCFKLLNTSDLPRSHVRVALPASLSARSFFFTSACPGQSTQRKLQGGCRPLTHASPGCPFHFSSFVASSLNVRGGWRVWSKDRHNYKKGSTRINQI